MAEREWLAERFEEQRPQLRAVAYRLLGSTGEADDAVQEAWLRLSRTEADGVDNLGAWLTTVVARLCLDMLRARAARREEPIGVHLPDPIVAPAETGDPEREAVLADTVGLAMLVVLDALTPAERLAFVLHDTFGLPFDEIAPIVRRSPVATRQLASRARRRVRSGAPAGDMRRPVGASPARERELVAAFLGAARDGDFEALLRILDPDVTVRADFGPGVGPLGPSRVIRGARAVATQAVAFRGLAPGARRATVNGLPGLVVFSGDQPYAVVAFAFAGDGISEIDILTDPARLARLDLSAVAP